ncbi:hypothetical protein VPH35_081503 [Triticum aestivum]
MATALRHAARRFGTRAAAEAEAEAIIERSPLYTSTRIVDSTTGRDLTPNQRKDAIFRLAQIHAQKEDLYNTIAAWQADYTAKGNVVTRKNNLLLKQLSQHVKPRPDDPRWYLSPPFTSPNNAYIKTKTITFFFFIYSGQNPLIKPLLAPLSSILEKDIHYMI